ncbi:hypothetical protein [Mycolicibacterium cosmeticum]|uniref:hypothetical protein n=1 Tax=Mycolicibacterium cosmeticum TaxID=258533 RepID=UPI003204996E
MSIGVDGIDSLLGLMLDLCDVSHQLCCGTAGFGENISLDLVAPVGRVHGLEPRCRLRNTVRSQAVDGGSMCIRRGT